MNLKELISKTVEATINQDTIDAIERRYKFRLSDELKRIISLNQEAVFYDDRDILRGLSNAETLNATEDLEVDFVGKSILPLFDIGDNDFIVFDFSDDCWYLFNIVDEVSLRKLLVFVNICKGNIRKFWKITHSPRHPSVPHV